MPTAGLCRRLQLRTNRAALGGSAGGAVELFAVGEIGGQLRCISKDLDLHIAGMVLAEAAHTCPQTALPGWSTRTPPRRFAGRAPGGIQGKVITERVGVVVHPALRRQRGASNLT